MNLISGEKLEFLESLNGQKAIVSDEEINQLYIKGEIRIVTEQARYPLPSIVNMVESNDYELSPEFQRRHRWNVIQKSRLIESFIMNVPIPPIFLYEDKFSHYEVMDGLQRMTAIYEFYSDKFELQGLEQWPSLNGKRCSTLPLQIKKGIDRRYLSSIILLKETAKDLNEEVRLKQLVFERINSGGVQLQPQESRNAIFGGPFNELCISLSRTTSFCELFGIPVITDEERENDILDEELLSNDLFREMTDVELVLRFFANRQRNTLMKGMYLRDYLDAYLVHANNFSDSTMEQLKSLFIESMDLIFKLMNEKAFWMYRQRTTNKNWYWYPKASTAIYDPLMVVISELINEKDKLLAKKDVIEDKFKKFYQKNYATFEGRNTNPGVVKERETKFRKFFISLLA